MLVGVVGAPAAVLAATVNVTLDLWTGKVQAVMVERRQVLERHDMVMNSRPCQEHAQAMMTNPPRHHQA